MVFGVFSVYFGCVYGSLASDYKAIQGVLLSSSLFIMNFAEIPRKRCKTGVLFAAN